MPPQQSLPALYKELLRSFTAQPCDLKKCGGLLSQLKVCFPSLIGCFVIETLRQIGLIEAGLLLPQGEPNPNDLLVARKCAVM